MKVSIIVAAAILPFLCACSGGPSDGDMKRALQNEANRTTAIVNGGIPGLVRQIEIGKVNSLGCTAASERVFRCDIEVEMITKDGQVKNVATVSFIKGSDGWVTMR